MTDLPPSGGEIPPAPPAPPWAPAPPPEPEAFAPPPIVPPEIRAEPLNPWLSMWTRPRATMRQILDTNPRTWVHALAMLGGISELLVAPVPRPLADVSPAVMLAGKILCGILLGLIGLYLGSFLVWVTGRWIGGQGTFVDVRAASAWPNVLSLWGALLWLPLIAYLGMGAFTLHGESLLDDSVGMMMLLPVQMIGLAIGVWRLVVALKCLGEAHRFSAWRALGAALIGGILVTIPLAILAGLVIGMAGLSVLSGS